MIARPVSLGAFDLRYARWDGGSGDRPLLVLSGIGTALEAVGPLARALPERTILSVDMPGIGGSGRAVPYTLAAMAAALAVVLDREGHDAVDVYGFSWGGALAQQFALQHPARVERLILAASSPGFPAVPADARSLAALHDPVGFYASILDEANLPTRRFLSSLAPPTGWGYVCQLAALAGWSSAAALPWLTAPTLLLAGAEDRIVPAANSRLLAVMIPKSECVITPRAGHLFPYTHAGPVADEIDRFLSETAAPRRWAA